MRKLGEKVVAHRIQDFGGELFHRLQDGLVRGRSAVDVLYRSVRGHASVLIGEAAWGGVSGTSRGDFRM